MRLLKILFTGITFNTRTADPRTTHTLSQQPVAPWAMKKNNQCGRNCRTWRRRALTRPDEPTAAHRHEYLQANHTHTASFSRAREALDPPAPCSLLFPFSPRPGGVRVERHQRENAVKAPSSSGLAAPASEAPAPLASGVTAAIAWPGSPPCFSVVADNPSGSCCTAALSSASLATAAARFRCTARWSDSLSIMRYASVLGSVNARRCEREGG